MSQKREDGDPLPRVRYGSAEVSGAFTIRNNIPTFMELTYSVWVSGSNDAPPQLAPSLVPGNRTVGFRPRGVNKVPKTAPSMSLLQYALDSGVTSVRSSGLKLCRMNGAGFTGNGCVGQADSPGISLGGTGFSAMSNSGSPVARSKRNVNPVLVTWATASTILPSRRTVTGVGCAGRS